MEVKPGYKKSEVGAIPEDWETRFLKQITLDMLQGVNTAIDKPEYVLDGIPMLKANNVIDGEVIFAGADHISQKTFSGYSDRFRPKKNDFLFSNIGARLGTGSLLKLDIDCSFAWNVMRIVPDTRKVTPEYLCFLINSPKCSQEIQSKQSGSGMGFVPKAVMQGLVVALPKRLEEQRAIAGILSDADALLGALDRLIAKKRDLKQAAMQQLLNGQTRLPGFHGEWKRTKIYELCDYVDGESTAGGDLGYVEIGDINVDSKSYDVSQKEKLSVRGAVRVPSGTLLISTVRPTRGAIAITRTAVHVSSAFCRLRPTNGFLYHLVCQASFLTYLGENSIGGTYPTCRDETILGFESLVPSDPAEQTAIAEVLTGMDAELAALGQRREKTRALKQGMMQELLTGRIRLV